jgi:hypothetical protein
VIFGLCPLLDLITKALVCMNFTKTSTRTQ